MKHSPSNGKWRFYLICWLSSFVAIFGILLFVPFAPSGKYAFNTLASEGNAYLFFQKAKISLVVYDRKGEKSEVIDIGSYEYQNNKWVCMTKDGHQNVFRCNIFWIEFKLENGKWDKHWRSLPWQR